MRLKNFLTTMTVGRKDWSKSAVLRAQKFKMKSGRGGGGGGAFPPSGSRSKAMVSTFEVKKRVLIKPNDKIIFLFN